MMTSKIVRSVAVAAALTLVLVVAVRNAVASATSARAAATLVEVQRNMRIMVTPLVANNDITQAQKNKRVDVAIMGGDNSWSFADIDGPTVEFAGSLPAQSSSKSQDVDQDGNTDRIYNFTTGQLKLLPTDTLACLTFETIQKIKYRGCDKVKVIPAKAATR